MQNNITIDLFDNIILNSEECINNTISKKLLKDKQLIVYDGFEPSGKMHIAQGLLRIFIANKFIQAGCRFKFLLADWYAIMNLKFGGDMTKIKNAGRLFIETWKSCGLDLSNTEFIWSSDIIRDPKYWELVLDISSKFTLNRIKKCTQIMGRNEKDTLMGSQIFYPVMQTADIYYLNVDICNLGLDQRKVNMLALEYGEKQGLEAPVIISNHILMGLTGKKMSKSDPNSAIFMYDNEDQVKSKIMKAYCPPNEINDNPIIEYIKYLIFPMIRCFMGFSEYSQFENAYINTYKSEDIKQIKEEVTKCINLLLNPSREYFKNNKEAQELLHIVMSY
jgi:tyrosyl-tRNA synthetase